MLEFPIEFFDDEVRDGFYVPSIMKHCWAGQMEVLNEVDRICKKYDIKYFIFSGTLMGAVRHGGFIPWDDDMDICLLREDYMRFLEVADSELPERYAVRSIYSNYKHRELFARVQNDTDVALHPDFWKKGHGFICNSAIDMFPLDYIPEDTTERKRVSDELLQLYFIVSEYDKFGLTEQINGELTIFEKKYHKRITRDDTIPQQLFLIMEEILCGIDKNKCEKVHIAFVWMQKSTGGIQKKYFENVIRIPFETAEFDAPLLYDAVLKRMFGQYMKCVRVCDIHNYPWYQPILDDIREYHGLGDYPFLKELLPESDRREKWENKIVSELNETLGIFEKAGKLAEQAFNNGDSETGNMLLVKCQMLAQNAELMEKRLKGNERKRVIFLTYKAEYWKFYEAYYRKEISEGNEVLVVPVPYTRLTETRERTLEYLETEGFPDEIILTDFNEIDYEGVRISKIYTQNIYDDQNGAISLRPFFHTVNIRKFTDELIYVPWFELDEYGADDERAIYMQQYFMRQPGIVAVDKILISESQSWIRNLYIEDLTKWAGEETREIWEAKIRVSEFKYKRQQKNTDGDVVLNMVYYIGLGQMMAHPEMMIEKIKSNIDVFDAVKKRIKVNVFVDSAIENKLGLYSLECKKMFIDLCNKYKEKKWCNFINDNECLATNRVIDLEKTVENNDFFYGDAGFLMHMFLKTGKPVMEQNAQILKLMSD